MPRWLVNLNLALAIAAAALMVRSAFAPLPVARVLPPAPPAGERRLVFWRVPAWAPAMLALERGDTAPVFVPGLGLVGLATTEIVFDSIGLETIPIAISARRPHVILSEADVDARILAISQALAREIVETRSTLEAQIRRRAR